MNLDITPDATKDMTNISSYIRNQIGNPSAAISILDKMDGKIQRIPEFPGKGVPIGPLLGIDTHYRFVVCGNYKIFYRHEADTIFIDRVLHNKQNYMKILFSRRKHS